MDSTTARVARKIGDDYAQSIALHISRLLIERGVSQVKLAERSGIPRVTLHRRLAGRTPFSVDELAAVADALDVPIFRLIGRPTHDRDALTDRDAS